MRQARLPMRTLKAVALALLIVGFPVAYAMYVNTAPVHVPYSFLEGLRNPGFATGWRFVENVLVGGYLVTDNETLSIVSNGTMPLDGIVGAEGMAVPVINFHQYPYLRISVRAPPVFVGVRIMIWTDQEQPFLVLKKTYGSGDWHTEVINLNFLGLTGEHPITKVELTWVAVERPAPAGTVVTYRDLAFGDIP